MSERFRHVAVTVPDLEQAESYYTALFDMRLITREAPGPQGGRQLPMHKTWADARAAGVELYMVALQRGDIVLVLFDEASSRVNRAGGPHRPLIIGLNMSTEEIAAVRGRLGDAEEWEPDRQAADRCLFNDRYGISWQLDTRAQFVGNGEGRGWWLDIDTSQPTG